MEILVTGAAGYIGSTFSLACLKKGFKVVGIDNFSNSTAKNVNIIKEMYPDDFSFIEADLAIDFEEVFAKLNQIEISVVVHFAGLKAVGESQVFPFKYWENNLVSTMNLIKFMTKKNIRKLIFSSSATVYGNSEIQPLTESNSIKPTSCYGSTKIANEFFLHDIANNDEIDVISLRYFNPVGSHKEKIIYEEFDQSPNNLMPRILRVAKGLDEKLLIFGNDYDTNDGTGERDYIHIDDLIEAHIKSIEKIGALKGYNFFNIGTGIKHSVLELVSTFEKANNLKISYEFAKRRDGDVPVCFANPSKAEKILKWKAKNTLFEMCKDSWDAIKKL